MEKINFPLWLIVLINMNVMIGAGVFIYPGILTKFLGPFGFLSYFAVACIMLPLVFTIAQLAKLHPAMEGGFYTYSKEGIGRWAGVLSVGSYFVGKAVSCAILIRTIVNYLYSIIPFLSHFPIVYSRILLLIFLIFLNMLGIRFGGRLQVGFMFFKIIPIALVILGGFLILNPQNFSFSSITFWDFGAALPFALYATMGFETCCALGHTVKAAKIMSRAVVISFFAVASIYTFFQFFLFGGLGKSLIGSTIPIGLFFVKLFGDVSLWPTLGSAFVMLSILGACYGMIFANNWNAFIITKETKMPIFKFFKWVNRFGAPVVSILLQSLIILFFTTINTNIVFLGRLTVFGIVISYTLTVISLLLLYRHRGSEITLPWWVVSLGLVSCGYIGFNCIRDLF